MVDSFLLSRLGIGCVGLVSAGNTCQPASFEAQSVHELGIETNFDGALPN